MIGRRVAHYQILERLGAGGMGEIFLAEDTRLRRRVAIKLLPPELVNPERLERLVREAKTVAALSHPNIVTLYSIEEADELHFLTMELVDGQTLGDLIPAKGMALDRLLDIAVPLAEALSAAHERGVTHRDLKPGNVMVTREGRVKVLDFGLAKLRAGVDDSRIEGLPTEALTREGLIMGTLPYMSPEQVEGRRIDPRTDIFSAGVVLYEMATGERPFAGQSSAALITAILRDQPPPPTSRNQGLPPEIDRIVARCLEKDRELRYQNAKDLRNDLLGLRKQMLSEELLGSRPASTSAPRSTTSGAAATTAVRPRPRRLALWAGAAALLAVLLVGGGVLVGNRGRSGPAAAAESARPSLAVLPLTSLTAEPEYFVDGMTEALIAAVANVRGLRVISRQSVMRYKGSAKSLPEIAGELGVGLILEGSVGRSGDRVRVQTKLTRAQPDEQVLLSKVYDRELRDVLALQWDVAQAIAQEIQVELTPQEEARAAGVRPVEPAVYEAYLRGRHHWNKRTQDELYKAIAEFERALALDPSHAPSYAGLADSWALLGYLYVEPEQAFGKAEKAALKALELDGGLAEAHVSLGLVRFFYDWDWPAAEAEFKSAIDLNPNYALGHLYYWAYLRAMGRLEEALQEIRRAEALDPLSLPISASLAVHYYVARDYPRAIEQANRALEMEPQFPTAYLYLWLARVAAGGSEAERLDAFTRWLATSGFGDLAGVLPEIRREQGEKAAVREAAEGLIAASRTRRVPPEWVAFLLAVAGEHQRAIDWLERAVDQRAPGMVYINVASVWDPLRREPRFQALVERMRLPKPPA
jgi:eukaryotic-like serine/threonine-protein kinase